MNDIFKFYITKRYIDILCNYYFMFGEIFIFSSGILVTVIFFDFKQVRKTKDIFNSISTILNL